MSTPMAISIDVKADWEAAADQCIGILLERSEESDVNFSADDLHGLIEQLHPGTLEQLTSGQRSAWPGAYFKQLARDGAIVKAGWSASSTKSRRHGSRHEWKAAA